VCDVVGMSSLLNSSTSYSQGLALSQKPAKQAAVFWCFRRL
jgi:hypothetical protein